MNPDNLQGCDCPKCSSYVGSGQYYDQYPDQSFDTFYDLASDELEYLRDELKRELATAVMKECAECHMSNAPHDEGDYICRACRRNA